MPLISFNFFFARTDCIRILDVSNHSSIRRSAAERLLRTIKEGSSFSMMHTLLVYLQSVPPEHSPVVAGLLLQLDLLVEPRKISMYREEAVDCLIQCLKNTDFPRCQLLATETIMCLPGKFSSSGRPLARSTLLKLARVKERYRQSQDLNTARADGEDEMVGGQLIRSTPPDSRAHEERSP